MATNPPVSGGTTSKCPDRNHLQSSRAGRWRRCERLLCQTHAVRGLTAIPVVVRRIVHAAVARRTALPQARRVVAQACTASWQRIDKWPYARECMLYRRQEGSPLTRGAIMHPGGVLPEWQIYPDLQVPHASLDATEPQQQAQKP